MSDVSTMASGGAAAGTDWKWLYLSLQGRATRKQFWLLFLLPYMVGEIVLGMITGAMMGGANAGVTDPADISMPWVPIILLSLWGLLGIWPSLAVAVKRCHDRNRSGWFIFANLIPMVGAIWYLIETGFLRGTVGDNRFGPDPLA